LRCLLSLFAGCGPATTDEAQHNMTGHGSSADSATGTPRRASDCANFGAGGACVFEGGHQRVRTCNPANGMLLPDVDCTTSNKVCGFDASGLVTCLQPGGSKSSGAPGTPAIATGASCGLTTYQGSCIGNSIHYCNQAQLTDQPCAAGFTCMPGGCGGGIGAECCPTPSSATGPSTGGVCDTLSYARTCSLDQRSVSFCERNQVQVRVCPSGTACQLGSSGIADCYPPGGLDPLLLLGCGLVTSIGSCSPDGRTIAWCEDNEILQADCLPGTTCQFDTCSAGINDCCPPSGVGFGGIACAVNGLPGTCMAVAACLGFSTPGHCPGPGDVQCCTR
jgi:hypothetical protein